VGHALIMKAVRYAHKSVVTDRKGDHLQDQNIEGCMWLKQIFKKYGVGCVD